MSKMPRPTDRAEYVLSRALGMGVLLVVVLAASAFAASHSARMERTHHSSVATASAGLEPDTGRTPGAPKHDQGGPGDPAMVGGSMAGVGAGIWVDGRGRAVPPPPGADEALVRAAIDAGTLLIAGGALLAGLRYLTRRAITRRNLRQWELEWQRIGREWSSGRR
jgi:hypothetical protein